MTNDKMTQLVDILDFRQFGGGARYARFPGVLGSRGLAGSRLHAAQRSTTAGCFVGLPVAHPPSPDSCGASVEPSDGHFLEKLGHAQRDPEVFFWPSGF